MSGFSGPLRTISCGSLKEDIDVIYQKNRRELHRCLDKWLAKQAADNGASSKYAFAELPGKTNVQLPLPGRQVVEEGDTVLDRGVSPDSPLNFCQIESVESLRLASGRGMKLEPLDAISPPSDGNAPPAWPVEKQVAEMPKLPDEIIYGAPSNESSNFKRPVLGDLGHTPPNKKKWTRDMKTTTDQGSGRLTPLAKSKRMLLAANQTWLQRTTSASSYEIVNAVAIVLNALFVIIETEYRSVSAMNRSYASNFDSGTMYSHVISDLFCLIFSTDLTLRILSERAAFFRRKERLWNVFDFVVVLIAVLETIARWSEYASGGMSSMSDFLSKFAMLRIIRLLRVVRWTRAIRTNRFFRELRIMVYSLMAAVKPLIWSVVLMGVFIVLFGVFFVDGLVAACTQLGPQSPQCSADLQQYFGTLSRASTSLYMSMSGGVDWGDVYEALRRLSNEYRYVFLLFITLGIMALQNVVTAVFVEVTTQRAQKDRELLVQQETEERIEFMQTMQRVFDELDTNGSGTLSLGEFEQQMDDEHILSFLSTLAIDVKQVRTLLMLLDRNQDGEVDIEEFINGCLRLKGEAKSLDMAILQFQVEWLVHNTSSLRQLVAEHLQPSLAKASSSAREFFAGSLSHRSRTRSS
eukprot:TRINITY_DN18009_c1_g2_i1.p1 TRINITY_DN18009_c1_g2~~TRINITY_DN18009_c1_g2_i1.p1  ORF type:complete len:635 (+),score=101.23 TRINITY_DN18009_c1_g2_i1:30-1934(+)